MYKDYGFIKLLSENMLVPCAGWDLDLGKGSCMNSVANSFLVSISKCNRIL